jgi:predicted GIY-YIG superfamily endonuclease
MIPSPRSQPRGPYWAYMVQCKYGTYYVGWTNDLKKRIAAHNDGTGAKYLRGKGPVQLVYKKKYPTVKKARAQERLIKSLTRKKKEALINE